MNGVLVLAGPTASGKTRAALELARTFGAEIVGADSRQIYRGMPVGTAAPSAEELAAAPHHLVEFLDPRQRYSAARFSQDAVRIIEDVRRRGGRAIVAGGTGFYIRALTGAVELAPQFDEQLRGRLAREARLHDAAFLHEWLSFHDRARAQSLHPQDAYRVLRALEVALGGDAAMQRREPVVSLQSAGIPFVKAFLEIDDATLKHNIEDRTRTMLARGLLEEAERIGPEAIAASAVGYPQADAYLRGWCTEGELQTLLNRATWRYAKRQQTWFRTEPQTIRVPVADARATLARLAREKLGWA